MNNLWGIVIGKFWDDESEEKITIFPLPSTSECTTITSGEHDIKGGVSLWWVRREFRGRGRSAEREMYEEQETIKKILAKNFSFYY